MMTDSRGTLLQQREAGVGVIAMLIAGGASLAIFMLAMGRSVQWSVPASLASALIVGSLAARMYRMIQARRPDHTSDMPTR